MSYHDIFPPSIPTDLPRLLAIQVHIVHRRPNEVGRCPLVCKNVAVVTRVDGIKSRSMTPPQTPPFKETANMNRHQYRDDEGKSWVQIRFLIDVFMIVVIKSAGPPDESSANQ